MIVSHPAMPQTQPTNSPTWLNRDLYPFESRTVNLPQGTVHYVDTGADIADKPTLVMVHGTPSWSFLYRHYIQELSQHYRCIALDNLGFGLSGKPTDFAYTPQAHAEVFADFVETLQLTNITLLVHDFGGPIGLSYALSQPDNVRALVISNTWLWTNEQASMKVIGRLTRHPLGRYWYVRGNVSVGLLLKYAGFAKPISPEVYAHYQGPLARPQDRYPTWALVQALTGANDWYDSLWNQREVLTNLPMLLLWGLQDKVLPSSYLTRWREAFPEAQVGGLEAGHFLQEDAPREATSAIHSFLTSLTSSSS
ncbi:MAG: alpha/beta fold hydrolase [Deinococcota bacterium]